VATQTAIQIALEREGIGFSFAADGNGGKKACGITFSEPEKASEL
jgi:hypothetical protein